MRGRLVARFAVPRVAEAPQGNSRLHHHERARRTREIREAAWLAAQAADRTDWEGRVIVTVTHERTDRRICDPGNVAAWEKPLTDGAVDAGLIPKDDWRHVAEVRLRIAPGCDTERFVYTITEAN